MAANEADNFTPEWSGLTFVTLLGFGKRGCRRASQFLLILCFFSFLIPTRTTTLDYRMLVVLKWRMMSSYRLESSRITIAD